MGITTLLSMTVFLMLVAENMPPTSDVLPLVGKKTLPPPPPRARRIWEIFATGGHSVERIPSADFATVPTLSFVVLIVMIMMTVTTTTRAKDVLPNINRKQAAKTPPGSDGMVPSVAA